MNSILSYPAVTGLFTAVLLILSAWNIVAAEYILQSQAVASGAVGVMSPQYRMDACAIGEAAVGLTADASYIVNAGFVPAVAASAPRLSMSITNFRWGMNAALFNTLNLDSFFYSPDGSPLVFWVTGSTMINVQIDPVTHWVTFSQPGGFSGLERVRFAAADPEGNVVWSGSVALLVVNPSGNNPPVLNPMSDVVANEGDLIQLHSSAVDVDGNQVFFRYSSPFLPNGAWQTGYDDAGSYSVTVTASDGTLQDSLTLNLTVRNVNRPPIVTPIAPITITGGQLLVISPTATDPDGQPVTLTFWPPLDTNGRWQTTRFGGTAFNAGNITNLVFTATDGEAVVTNIIQVTIIGDWDGDGLSDWDELYVYGTNPFNADTDGDGMPDAWEIAHGLNPRVNDANGDMDRSGISNLAKYLYGLTNSFKPDPSRAYSLGDTISDFERMTGTPPANRFYYDKNDRLIGAEYANGFVIAYVYDGNNNPLYQVYSSRQTETSLLPLPWLAKFGLLGTNAATANGPYDDPDGDGWSNYQEWLAGTNPNDARSVPTTNVVQTAPLVRILPDPNHGSTLALVHVRIWDSEGNRAMPFLQYSNATTLAWSNATLALMDGTNAMFWTNGLSAPPTGATHELAWNAASDLGSVRKNVFLRAIAQDQASTNLFSDWSDPVPYFVDTIDSDNDGLPDAWEMQHFGTLAYGPNDDPDHDDFTNLQEYLADTDPVDSTSYLRITSVSSLPGGVKLDWQGGVQATQFLQRILSLDGTNIWLNIQTALPPTPITGSYTDWLATNAMQFYRIKVSR